MWFRRKKHVVIGLQAARARENEARHRASQSNQSSPLAGVRYETDGDLEETDRRVAEFADAFARSPGGRADLAAALTTDDFYVLTTFAKRAAGSALARRDPQIAQSALWALAAIDHDRIDFRDISWAAAYGRMAMTWISSPEDSDEAFLNAAECASGQTAEILRQFVGVSYQQLCEHWRMRVVSYRGSDAFLEFGTDTFEPTIDLLRTADRIRSVLEPEYETSNPTLATNVGFAWLKDSRDCQSLMNRALGSVFVDAYTPMGFDRGQLFLAFAIEQRTSADAEAFEVAWRSGTRKFASLLIRNHQLLILLISSSYIEGTPTDETDDTLKRFLQPFTALAHDAINSLDA